MADDFGNAQQILVGFGGQTHHEIQLDAVITGGKGQLAGFQQVFFLQVLVDNIAQTLGTGFGCKGQTAFTHLLNILSQIQIKGVGAHGRQCQVDVHRLKLGHQTLAQGLQMGIVAGAQTGERNLIPAGVGNQRLGLLFQGLGLLCANGTIGVAGLAETAATAAAAEQLDHGAVKHNIGGGHHEFFRIIDLVQILHHTLADNGRCAILGSDGGNGAVFFIGNIIQGRHINAADLGGLFQELGLAFVLVTALPVQSNQLGHDFLAFANGDQIKEVGHRLSVINAGTAGDDQRLQAVTVGRALWHAGQIQHIEHAGIVHLILEGKTQNVELTHGIAALQGIQRLTALAHLLFHIQEGCIGALAPDAIHTVQETIEDLGAQMGHTDFINIRETKGKAQIHLAFVLINCVVFAAGIASRLAHMLQTGTDRIVHNFLPNHNLNIYFNSFFGRCKGFFPRDRSKITPPAEKSVGFPPCSSIARPIRAKTAPKQRLTRNAKSSPSMGYHSSKRFCSTLPPSSGSAGSKLKKASTR